MGKTRTNKKIERGILLKIWVDADGCPKAVKDILFKAAKRVQTPMVFVANRAIKIPPSPWLEQIIVPKGFDVADGEIVERVEPFDLVITSDIPLADEVVAIGGTVINFRGDLLTEENIRERRSLRDFFQELRDSGTQTGGPKAFGETEKRAFAATFDREITRMLAEERERPATSNQDDTPAESQ
jgi:uncharacterized protein YaiI (UPF0178 family)